ncbi:MAG TPA: LD-carboxypeptidase [Polyangia bacterium]
MSRPSGFPPSALRPPRLASGDVVRIVAPSGPVPRVDLVAGARLLAQRYRVRYDPATLFRSEGYLAGSDEQRLAELEAALSDPVVKAVFLARGGYGLLRILPFIDRARFAAQPKPIIGFSDGTALLALAATAGVASIHGPVVAQLAKVPQADRDALFGLLERPGQGLLLSELASIIPGRVQGRLIGGNLEVFSRLIGTPFLPDPTGAILFIEDVGERPYRVDRLITHLDLAGIFDAVSGVVVGDFKDCREPANSRTPDSPLVEAVLEERLGRLPIPVAFGGKFGHGESNAPLPYGTLVELDTRQEALLALEGAVS